MFPTPYTLPIQLSQALAVTPRTQDTWAPRPRVNGRDSLAVHVQTRYPDFASIVTLAKLDAILDDPQSSYTLFVPLEMCKEIATFELARKVVDSLLLKGFVNTTSMMQSAVRRYRTRDPVNTLTMQTGVTHHAAHTFNKPPFGICLNQVARIVEPDVQLSNGVIHTIDFFPYADLY